MIEGDFYVLSAIVSPASLRNSAKPVTRHGRFGVFLADWNHSYGIDVCIGISYAFGPKTHNVKL